MTALLLAACSAAVYGSADYCGGVATRRAHPVAVVVLSQAVSIPPVVLVALLMGGAAGVVDLAWGAAAGVAGMTGLILLYRGLSRGVMTVVAPTTAVTAAVVPLLVGLTLERWPRPLALLGIGCAVVAIGLVSLVPHESSPERSPVTAGLLATAVLAGFAFGMFFTALDRSSADAGLWPLVVARFVSVTLGLGLVAGLSAPLRTPGVAWWVVGAGLLDVTANGLYLVAAQLGRLALVAPLASLYPVSTVLLALLVDRERVRLIQVVGLGLAASALVLVTGFS